jgi:hypothetical protein
VVGIGLGKRDVSKKCNFVKARHRVVYYIYTQTHTHKHGHYCGGEFYSNNCIGGKGKGMEGWTFMTDLSYCGCGFVTHAL